MRILSLLVFGLFVIGSVHADPVPRLLNGQKPLKEYRSYEERRNLRQVRAQIQLDLYQDEWARRSEVEWARDGRTLKEVPRSVREHYINALKTIDLALLDGGEYSDAKTFPIMPALCESAEWVYSLMSYIWLSQGGERADLQRYRGHLQECIDLSPDTILTSRLFQVHEDGSEMLPLWGVSVDQADAEKNYLKIAEALFDLSKERIWFFEEVLSKYITAFTQDLERKSSPHKWSRETAVALRALLEKRIDYRRTPDYRVRRFGLPMRTNALSPEGVKPELIEIFVFLILKRMEAPGSTRELEEILKQRLAMLEDDSAKGQRYEAIVALLNIDIRLEVPADFSHKVNDNEEFYKQAFMMAARFAPTHGLFSMHFRDTFKALIQTPEVQRSRVLFEHAINAWTIYEARSIWKKVKGESEEPPNWAVLGEPQQAPIQFERGGGPHRGMYLIPGGPTVLGAVYAKAWSVHGLSGTFPWGWDSVERQSLTQADTLEDFYIDAHPVSISDFKIFLSRTGQNHEMRESSPPDVLVHYEAARGYCRSKGKRLPTALEWARVYSGGEILKLFPWGNAMIKDADEIRWPEYFRADTSHEHWLEDAVTQEPYFTPVRLTDQIFQMSARQMARALTSNDIHYVYGQRRFRCALSAKDVESR